MLDIEKIFCENEILPVEKNPYALKMRDIDPAGGRIIFEFTTDNFTPDKIQGIKAPQQEPTDILIPDEKHKTWSFTAADGLLSEIAAQSCAFSVVLQQGIGRNEKLKFRNIKLEPRGERHYSLYYCTKSIRILLGTFSKCSLMHDYTDYKQKIVKHIIEIPGCVERNREYMFAVLNWKRPENDPCCSQLQNCFDYTVCNSHSVILELKDGLDPIRHLLKFDNFNRMYDMFKFERIGESKVYNMYKTWDNYKMFNIHKGGSYVDSVYTEIENMIQSLATCIEAVCGIMI